MTYEEIAEDDKTAFAVIRAFEIIGEAAPISWRIKEMSIKRYHGIGWWECVTF